MTCTRYAPIKHSELAPADVLFGDRLNLSDAPWLLNILNNIANFKATVIVIKLIKLTYWSIMNINCFIEIKQKDDS